MLFLSCLVKNSMDPGDMQMSFKMASDMHMSQSTVSKVHVLCTAVNNFN